MSEEGYSPAFVASLIAAASTIAALVPPSIMAVVYGAIGNVSIAGLFLAGIVPGLMVGIGLMIYSYPVRPGRLSPAARHPAPTGHRCARAALTLLIPVILLGGVLTGWFTPTEAGVIAIVYILVSGDSAAQPRHFSALPRDFVHAGVIFTLPMITIAAASSFGWMLAYLRGPIVVAGWITGVAGNDPYAIMFLLVALFVIVGDFIEPIPAIVIFMPIVNTLTEAGNIHSVHMGVVLIITLAFGLITPPYGLALLMASKFVNVGFGTAIKASLPIYLIFFATIAVAIFFPEFVLWLPKHVFPESVGCFKAPGGAGYICP